MPNIETIMRQITGDMQPAVIFKTTENSKCTETSNSEDKLKGVLYIYKKKYIDLQMQFAPYRFTPTKTLTT